MFYGKIVGFRGDRFGGCRGVGTVGACIAAPYLLFKRVRRTSQYLAHIWSLTADSRHRAVSPGQTAVPTDAGAQTNAAPSKDEKLFSSQPDSTNIVSIAAAISSRAAAKGSVFFITAISFPVF